ncbi:MAG: glycosyltransferase family 39 protein [Anaerolineae bacterium]|nr:glycosyltransferase family 39 protein [Anaerolineae bacterium]
MIDVQPHQAKDLRLSARQTALVMLLLFALALVPRAWPSPVMTTDEQAFWVNRATNFLDALRTGDLSQTAQSFHPGVMTNWLGASGILLSEVVNGPDAMQTNFQAHIAAMRFPLALVNALTVVLAFDLLRRLFDTRIALAASLLWALDPFLVAHGGILHVDAITTSFMAVSFLTGLLAFHFDDPDGAGKPTRRGWFVASAVFGALGGVTKFTAIGVGGILGLCLLIQYRHNWRSWPRRAIAPMVIWTLIATVVWFGVFPATWVDMDWVIAKLDQGLELALNAHKPGNFFMGVPLEDPGPAFYLVATLLRITPWMLLGLLLAAVAALRGAARRFQLPLVAMIIFILVFGLVMTLQAKKLDRYVLQYFPMLAVLAAFGLVWLVDQLRDRLTRIQPALGWGLALVIPVLTLVWYQPYYLAYYNPVFGGSAGALHALLVGWGEGLDQAMSFAGEEVQNCDESVMTFYFEVASRYTDCGTNVHTLQDNPQGINDEKYLIFYVSQLQRGLFSRLIDAAAGVEPAHVVRIHGIDYALIYDTADLHYEPVPEDTFSDLAVFTNDRNDDVIRLKRWDLRDDVHVARCGSVTLDSWWEGDNPIAETYYLSMVAVDEGGEGVTRVEEAPGNVDTLVWQPGRYYHDIRTLQIPCDLPPGEYPLMFIIRERSLYWAMQAASGDGAPVGTLFYLTTLFVE